MLTTDELASLKVGDCVETYPLLKGLTPEPVVLRVVEPQGEETGVPMVATYLGVTLGRWVATAIDGSVKWKIAA